MNRAPLPSPSTLEKMVKAAFSTKTLHSCTLCSQGNSNFNFKIKVDNDFFILRIYLTDPTASYREQKLAVRLWQTIPIPLTYYMADIDGYRFAITQFLPGIRLKTYLQEGGDHSIMYDVGVLLAKISNKQFIAPGKFDQNLNISPQDDITAFINSLPKIEDSHDILTKFAHFLPSPHERSLVHGDFKTENILVDQIDGKWKITGIIDWEYSFSGSIFWDIANIMRDDFQGEMQFLKGLENQGAELSQNWKTTVHLLNLICFLDLFSRKQQYAEEITQTLEILRTQDMKHKLDVMPHNQNWAKIFEAEKINIQNALGENCTNIHHIGSTSIPGLIAKPIIDILVVVKKPSICELESIGYVYKGEVNIPFHYYFKKEGIHLHLYEEGNPEIMLNLMFKHHLSTNLQDKDKYASLKEELLSKEASFVKTNTRFTGYTLGKNDFIQEILKKIGFSETRLMHCTHTNEWSTYNRIRIEQSFDPVTQISPDHYHFILYQGTQITTIAHIEFMSGNIAILHELATDEIFKNQGFGKRMINLLEKWCITQNKHTLKMHAYKSAEAFYRKLGYQDMIFDYPLSPGDGTDLGKILTK